MRMIVIAIASAIASYFIAVALGGTHEVSITLAITLLTAILWITEAIPIPVASLIPFVGFPFAGILTHKEASSALGSHVIILLMGGFMLAKAIEKCGVHERFALNMIRFTGGNSGFKIIFAFMATAAMLSMWISNTATVLALLPVALAVTQHSDNDRFKLMLLLGLAYSASLGGVGTLIGTPPNVIFASVYEEFTKTEYGFLNWMKTGVPIILIGIPVMALWLSRGIKLNHEITLPATQAWRSEEARTIAVFAGVAFLWIFRREPFGGWSGLFDLKMVGDSTIALLGVVVMFIVPKGKGMKEKLLDWKTATDIPWGMLLLFSGGICIAKAFVASGLSQVIGEGLSGITELPIIAVMLLIALAVSFLTEITSNTATATLLMPILASAAVTNNIPLELIMIPAVISCSCAFCLPVATAPNSIIFASGNVTIKQMAREGMVLNVIVACVVSVVCYFTLA
ncbi:MAG: sodium-dependent dicarboxylate transporter 2/3/5 [Phenylobacterium sp.]|jgi:sodium-dependent dicarboxylate transporter 2/3/5